MLHNPKWDVEVKADPFSLESLIAWLEKQPADTAYDYTEPCGCLLAQYFTANGYADVAVMPNAVEYTLAGLDMSANFSEGLEFAAIGPENTRDWTFGAALARARAALSR